MVTRGRRSIAFVCCIAMFTGCGGGGGGSNVTGNAAGTGSVLASGPAIMAKFSFAVPQRSSSASVRRTTYISPSSQSLEIDVAYGTATSVGAQLNLAPLPADCTVVNGVTQCNIAVVAQASATGFIISFYDAPNSQGHLLSTASVPVPAAVNGVADVNATLLPVVASVQLALATPLFAGFAGSTTLVLSPLDADGNAIPGDIPFSIPVQLLPASSAITFVPNTVTSSSTPVTVSYSGAPLANTNIVAKIGTTTFTTQLPISNGGAPTPSLTITPADIGVSVGGPSVPIAVTLQNAPGPATLAIACTAGADISISQSTVPAGTPTSVAVTALVAPSGNPTHACTITGTAGAQSASVFVDVNTNSFSVNGHARTLP